jgi:CDGSH-type Zn-finger protein
MSEPAIPRKSPYALEPGPGKYRWCACGHSATQPFCDGSRKGTEFSPVPFELAEKRKVWLCGCKHTGHLPLCDGTHARL